jgi:hypothetical protein
MSDIFFARGGKLAFRKVAGEVVIMRADDSSLYVLNPVASAVWEAADGLTSLDTVVREVICRDFEVDAETARRDAAELVAALAAEGVLRTSDRPITSGDAPSPREATA